MRFPWKYATPLYSSALGIARERRHFPKPSFNAVSRGLPFSHTTFSPTTPISATPSYTYCGISSSRRYNTSIGKSGEAANNLPLPPSKLIPHSLNKANDFSLNLPDFWTAILNFSIQHLLN